MKYLRRILLPLAFITGIVCVVLLLNFTAPNPTGRRYSSRMPLSTGQGSTQQIGLAGELVLADDLRLPRNDAPDQLQCVCNSPTYNNPQNCLVCIVNTPLTAPYRRPDFVAPTFIAESKNAQNLYYASRDLAQIADYAVAARALQRPLWVFTRVNTDIDPEFARIVGTTGGSVIPYFTVPGYVDPVDQAAKTGLVVSAGLLMVTGLWEMGLRRQTLAQPRIPPAPKDPIRQAADAMEHIEAFTKGSKNRHRNRIND